jgi:hypothetical protein
LAVTLLALVETGPTLLISLLAETVLQLVAVEVADGIRNLNEPSTVMHTETQDQQVLVEAQPLLVVLVMEHGVMESTLPDLLILVSSVSSSA